MISIMIIWFAATAFALNLGTKQDGKSAEFSDKTKHASSTLAPMSTLIKTTKNGVSKDGASSTKSVFDKDTSKTTKKASIWNLFNKNKEVSDDSKSAVFFKKLQDTKSSDIVEIEMDGKKQKLCVENTRKTNPKMKLGDLFIDGKLSKSKLQEFVEDSMWLEGKVCNTDNKFSFISTKGNTKGSIFFGAEEKILDGGKLTKAPKLDAVLESPNHEHTEQEKKFMEEIRGLFKKDRRFLNDKSLQPGEVDIFVLVDVNPDVIEEIGDAESTITYVLNLFSWINSHVYYPIGFNVQVSEINLRTVSCGGMAQCMKTLRDNGQPSNAHLVHHMTVAGAIGYGSVGGLYTKSKFGGVSTCPKMRGNFGMWERICLSHELGHNFGGVHTHDQTPQLDQCGRQCDKNGNNIGTIMSYCHKCSGGYNNIKFEFHAQTRDTLWRLFDLKKNSKLNTVDAGTVALDGTTIPSTTYKPKNTATSTKSGIAGSTMKPNGSTIKPNGPTFKPNGPTFKSKSTAEATNKPNEPTIKPIGNGIESVIQNKDISESSSFAISSLFSILLLLLLA